MQPGPAAVHLSLYCNHPITSLPPPTFHQNECFCHIFLIINIFLGTKFRYPMLCILPLSQNPTIKRYAIFGVPYQLWTSMWRAVCSEQRKYTPMHWCVFSHCNVCIAVTAHAPPQCTAGAPSPQSEKCECRVSHTATSSTPVLASQRSIRANCARGPRPGGQTHVALISTFVKHEDSRRDKG